MQTTEQRLERLEKRNRHLTLALTVVAICGGTVALAEKGVRNAEFETLYVNEIVAKTRIKATKYCSRQFARRGRALDQRYWAC